MVVARFRSMALRPIHRIKHVVDASATLASGTKLNQALIVAVDAPTLGNITQVETGAKVNGIYLKIEVASNETEVVGAIPNVYLMVFKNPGGNNTFPNANVVGTSDLKRYVIHQEMIMMENSKGGNPRVLFNGVVVIPKGMRRFAPADELRAQVFSPQIDIAVCFQCHYKEFR